MTLNIVLVLCRLAEFRRDKYNKTANIQFKTVCKDDSGNITQLKEQK